MKVTYRNYEQVQADLDKISIGQMRINDIAPEIHLKMLRQVELQLEINLAKDQKAIYDKYGVILMHVLNFIGNIEVKLFT